MSDLQRHSSAHRVAVVLLFALMLAAGAAVGFFQTFSGFRGYDDEGYVIISVRSFVDGQPLYDKVYTQYGPVYYLYKASLHRITGLEVTHDAVRMMTIADWLLATLFCSLFSYRVTRSLFVASAVFLLTFRSLWMLTNEPGHPQELCALLLAVGVYLATFATSATRRHWVMASMGAVAAALLLTKINAGVYFCLALAGAMVSFAESQWLRRVASCMIIGLAIFVPICLMWSHLDRGYVQNYAAVAALSGVSALAVATVRNRGEFRLIDFAAAFAGFIVGVLIVFVAVAACGSSAAGFWEGVVTGPMRFAGRFLMLAVFPTPAAILAIVAAVAALVYSFAVGGLISLPASFAVAFTAAGVLIRLALITAVILVLTATCGTIRDLVAFATPWIWLAIIDPKSRGPTAEGAFSRTMVVLVAALEVLYAYPVAGSQWSIATFLIVPATAICAHDVWLQLQRSKLRLPSKIITAGALMGYVLMGMQWWSSGRSFAAGYWDQTALNLPGAHWMRVREYEAAILRCVSINLRKYCDTFFSAPGFNSFYVWSELKPPTGFNTTHWMTLLDDKQKNAIVEQLERHPRCWLIYEPKVFEFWLRDRNVSQSDDPLVRYCKEHFVPMVRVGDYDLCLPAGESRPLLAEAANVGSVPAAILSQPSRFGLPSGALPNVMIQPEFTLEADRRPELARVIVVDAVDRSLLADSNDSSNRGMKVLDADLQPVALPLMPGWNKDPQLGSLRLIPYQAWLPPKDYDYSKVLAGLMDEQGEVIVWLPVAIPLAQAAR